MFGFLRRKKPVDPAKVAPVPADLPADLPASPAILAEAETPVDALPLVDTAPSVQAATAAAAPPPTEPPPPPAAGQAPADDTATVAATDPAPTASVQAAMAPTPAPASILVPIAPPAPAPAPAPAPEPAPEPARKSWMARLKQGLTKTRGNLAGMFRSVKIDEALYEDLETALLSSDAGYGATERLLQALRLRVKERRLTDGEQVRSALRELITEQLMSLEQPLDIDAASPLVLMIAGVNGAGKTTSIGKLAHHLRGEGKSILLAAGDTFRAAAREQLATWGERNDVQVISQQGGDPAAVAFDAVSAGIARKLGVVMVDTAGRLPTQTHLMDELKKIKRVLGKAMPGAPHQSLLILDGNTGQNMLAQVQAFDDAVGLTGLVVTKLDGTAKGGALLGLAHLRRERPLPVYFIGVGEGIDDLQAFSAAEFAEALLGSD